MKSYRRYEPKIQFGIISAPQCNAAFDFSGNTAFTGAIQRASAWNIRHAEQSFILEYEEPQYPYQLASGGEVTVLQAYPNRAAIAVGYSSGCVRLFNYGSNSWNSHGQSHERATSTGVTARSLPFATLRGHSAAVLCLCFGGDCPSRSRHRETSHVVKATAVSSPSSSSVGGEVTLLASGGADGAIILWDLVSMTVRCQLRGHRDAVTGLVFIRTPQVQVSEMDAVSEDGVGVRKPVSVGMYASSIQSYYGGQDLLVSVSKDTLLKVWDYNDTQNCVQTVVGHRCEIWNVAAASIGADRAGSSCNLTEPAGAASVNTTTFLVTGAADQFLRGYLVQAPIQQHESEKSGRESASSDRTDTDLQILVHSGTVVRAPATQQNQQAVQPTTQGLDCCSVLSFNPNCSLLAASSATSGKVIEVFRVRQPNELQKMLKRRRKASLATKASTTASGANRNESSNDAELGPGKPYADFKLSVELLHSVRFGARVRSFQFSPLSSLSPPLRGSSAGGRHSIAGRANAASARSDGADCEFEDRALVSLSNNSMEVYKFVQMYHQRHAKKIEGYTYVRETAKSAEDSNETRSTKKRRLTVAAYDNYDPKDTTVALPAGVTGDSQAAAISAVPVLKFVSSAAPNRLAIVDNQGHRSDVRSICIADDGSSIATCSQACVKVWSTKQHNCVSTINLDGSFRSAGSAGDHYCLSVAFVPGGRHLLAATKQGRIMLIDSVSGEVVAEQLHFLREGNSEQRDSRSLGWPVWAVQVRPDGNGFAAGGGGGVSLFHFAVNNKGLSMEYARQLLMPAVIAANNGRGGADLGGQDVLCVRYNESRSADKLLLAVGLLDSTVRIYYEDSLKFLLSLYGHKLPVLTIDMSYDSTILASGSADKTIKLWGLDFGDCHRSLLAHEDSVTCVRFQPNTHYFFSAGKEGNIKYWDADRFEQILLLPGHKGCCWALCITPRSASDTGNNAGGARVYSVGQDRSVRVWERSEDLVFIEEERERALEAQVSESLDADAILDAQQKQNLVSGDGNCLVLNASTAVAGPGTAVESVRGAEAIMEAIDLAFPHFNDQRDVDVDGIVDELHHRTGNPLMLGLTPLRYMLRAVRRIKVPELEPTLTVLPFQYASRLLRILLKLADNGLEIELCVRCACCLILSHQNQLLHAKELLPMLTKLRMLLMISVSCYRTLVGINLAGLRAISLSLIADSGDSSAFVS